MLVLETRWLESALDETLQWPWKYSWSQYQYQSITQKKTVWKWSSVKEVSLQILQTEKLYNLCTRRWFLTASVQAYYDRRRRRCLNRVAKLEGSSLMNEWHKRTTQTFCMDFFAIFFHSSIYHSSGTENIRMIESFWVWQVSRRLDGCSNISNSHSLVLEATRDIYKWNMTSLAYSEFIYSWNFLMT
jgi:hypothetical protein